jgi:hypothetical protein
MPCKRALNVMVRYARRIACHVMTAISFVSAVSTIAAPDETPQDVGMVQLLGAPEKYDGKLIRVIGFLSLEFEGVGLYLHREDFQNGTGNGLWINPPEKTDPNLGRHYVEVVGTFEAKAGGHMGAYPAGIRNVTKLIDIETLWRNLKADDCAIPSAELSPVERKLVGSWEQKLSGERRVETFEADRTHWVVSIGPLGEVTLIQSSRWWIKGGFLNYCDVHRTPEDQLGPRRFGIPIDDIGPDKFTRFGGTDAFTRCKRPSKPSKSDLIRLR